MIQREPCERIDPEDIIWDDFVREQLTEEFIHLYKDEDSEEDSEMDDALRSDIASVERRY